METLQKNDPVSKPQSTNNKKVSSLAKGILVVVSLFVLSTSGVFAHCDTMDGPLVLDAKKALEQNNVNYALKWVPAENEAEIISAFSLVMKVRSLNADAKELGERYFFDILVRIHRAAEGVPFTGVKPSGTLIDPKVAAADKSIEEGNLSPLAGMVAKDDLAELTRRFKQVMTLRNFDVNNLAAGREYIEAYVRFFKFAEGEESHAEAEQGHKGHAAEHAH
jgi:hypothetical protein